MSYKNLNDFIGSFTREGARPTLFDVTMLSPISYNISAADKLKFTCKAAQLPGKTFGVIEVPYFGRKIKVAGDQTFAEWTVTVINDEDFRTRKAFELWMSGMNAHVENTRSNLSYKKGDAQVTQYSKNGDVAVAGVYIFKNIFPSELSPIDVAWDSNDALEEYTVTLQYDWWESFNTTS